MALRGGCGAARRLWRCVLPVGLLLLVGCSRKVKIESSPPGATVLYEDGEVGVTPIVLKLRWRPFGSYPVLVSLPEYRSVQISLDYEMSLHRLLLYPVRNPLVVIGQRPMLPHTVVMVREHGPAGTWGAEDVE